MKLKLLEKLSKAKLVLIVKELNCKHHKQCNKHVLIGGLEGYSYNSIVATLKGGYNNGSTNI